jgi:hypothetical protein
MWKEVGKGQRCARVDFIADRMQIPPPRLDIHRWMHGTWNHGVLIEHIRCTGLWCPRQREAACDRTPALYERLSACLSFAPPHWRASATASQMESARVGARVPERPQAAGRQTGAPPLPRVELVIALSHHRT